MTALGRHEVDISTVKFRNAAVSRAIVYHRDSEQFRSARTCQLFYSKLIVG